MGSVLREFASPRERRVISWRPHQVTHRPGRSTTVQYRVRSATASGRVADSTVVLAHGLTGPTATHSGGHQLQGWQLPDDPHLPGLARALDPVRVASLMELIGRPVGPPVLRRRAYRPGRRAVVEVTGPTGRVFLKVVRPQRAAALVDVHRRAGRTLPVPKVLGCTADGVVVLSALPGRTLRRALASIDPAEPEAVDRLPDLAAVVNHLDRLPAVAAAGPKPAKTPLPTSHRHVALLGTVLPDLHVHLQDMTGEITRLLRSDHPVVPVHGDLYESQLMVTRGGSPEMCGMLDLDTVGMGHRIDDLANHCAHLSTFAMRSAPPAAPPTPLGDPTSPVGRYLAATLAAAETDFDPIDLRARIAGRVIGLATGPFRVQEPEWPAATARRVDLAEAWLSSTTP